MKEKLPIQKLVSILYADVVGYSTLAGHDEIGTYRNLTRYYRVFGEYIKNHNGQISQQAGDSLLAFFSTATSALACAIEVQSKFETLNQDLPSEHQIKFRIGINLGEVNVNDDKIHGDSVNIAARLEGLAAPGGICVSESVRTAVGGKIAVGFEFLGEQTVQNIRNPVRPYHIRNHGNTTISKFNRLPKPASIKRGKTSFIVPITIALILGILLLGIRIIFGITNPDSESSPLVTRNKPSIAVLPFANLNSDPEFEQFSDGLTNDIITDLSKFSNLFVIAASSTFRYKNQPIKIENVAQDLNVRYVLEGTVQRNNGELRVNAQLIDGSNGQHIWAEKYHRKLVEFWKVQNEISKNIVSVIGPVSDAKGKLLEAELNRLHNIPTKNYTAYDHFLKGVVLIENFNKTDNILARDRFEKAIAIDPNYSKAYAKLAWTYIYDAWNGWKNTPKESFKRANEIALKAINTDRNEPVAHMALGAVQLFIHQHNEAIQSLKKAVKLNPNDADVLMYLGWAMTYSDMTEEGLSIMDEAISRNPYHPDFYHWDIAWGHFVQKSYKNAADQLEKRTVKSNFTHLILGICYTKLGQNEKAAPLLDYFKLKEPTYSVETAIATEPFKNKADLDHYLDALREVGIQEHSSGI